MLGALAALWGLMATAPAHAQAARPVSDDAEARAIGCTEGALRAVLDHPRIKTVPREFADQVEAAHRRLQA